MSRSDFCWCVMAFMQHVSDILWRSTAVAVQTSYFASASYFVRKPSDFKCVVILDDFGRCKITRAA